MKTRPKFFSFITSLFLGLFLAGCSQAPKEVDGKPVYVLDGTLLRPLEINTDKEQEFYFRFKRQPDSDTLYYISAVAVMPSEYEEDDFLKGDFLNDKLLREKRMSFELALTYYDKEGKAVPIGLSQYYMGEKPAGLDDTPVFGKKRFEGVHNSSFWNGIEEGYSGRSNALAVFTDAQKNGYYHLSIRALQHYRDYPKMKLAVKVAPIVFK